jgi:hypothetical protein
MSRSATECATRGNLRCDLQNVEQEIRPAVAVSPRTALAVFRKAVALRLAVSPAPVPALAMSSFTRSRRQSRDAGGNAFDRLRCTFFGKGTAGPGMSRVMEHASAERRTKCSGGLRDLQTAWLLWGAPGVGGEVCSAGGGEGGRASGPVGSEVMPSSRRHSIMAALPIRK